MARILKRETPFIPLIEKIGDKTSLVKIIENIMYSMKAGILLKRDGAKYAKPSIKNYRKTIYWLKNYETERGTIYLEHLDLELVEDFILFMKQEYRSIYSIANIVTVVKTVLRKMYKEGRISFNSSFIRIQNELKVALYNTEEDLTLMLNLDLSKTPPLQLVRDAYIIQCNTGLKFSHLKEVLANIKNHIIEENNNLYLEIQEKNITIPLPAIVKNILERNNYEFKETLDYTFYNSAIKIIAEMAGINNEIPISYIQKGTISQPKSTLLNTHTARRTFAIYGFLAEIPVSTIIQILGHATLQSFYKYVHRSYKKETTKITDHPYFNSSPKKETKPLQKSFFLPYAKRKVIAAA